MRGTAVYYPEFTDDELRVLRLGSIVVSRRAGIVRKESAVPRGPRKAGRMRWRWRDESSREGEKKASPDLDGGDAPPGGRGGGRNRDQPASGPRGRHRRV